MNRLPLTISHAKRDSDAYSVVCGCLQPVSDIYMVCILVFLKQCRRTKSVPGRRSKSDVVHI